MQTNPQKKTMGNSWLQAFQQKSAVPKPQTLSNATGLNKQKVTNLQQGIVSGLLQQQAGQVQ